MSDKAAVRSVLDAVKASGRTALTAPEAKLVCDAYQIPVPKEGLAKSADEAAKLAGDMGFPVVMKIVSPDILHKTEAGGVVVGVDSVEKARATYQTIVDNAKRYKSDATIDGIQIQQMLPSGATEVIVGSITDPSFGKLVAFGLGGILVEVLKDITFRLAPASKADAEGMLDGLKASEVLHGVRGQAGVNRGALTDIIQKVSQLVTDFPEIVEVDLNPIFATDKGATAVDARIVCDWEAKAARFRPNEAEIL
ncbi:MAG TPA: acetate--CoA ligase family protein, partial [Hyphomicrobiales bacterium]